MPKYTLRALYWIAALTLLSALIRPAQHTQDFVLVMSQFLLLYWLAELTINAYRKAGMDSLVNIVNLYDEEYHNARETERNWQERDHRQQLVIRSENLFFPTRS